MERKITRKVKVGSVYVGGDSPVSIQSMPRATASSA